MKTGIIRLMNRFGQLCEVPYTYDPALQDFKLVSNGEFTTEDVDRCKQIAPGWIMALILIDLQEKKTGNDPYLGRPYPWPLSDRGVSGL